MRIHDHSQVRVAVDGWVERPTGHRRVSETLAAGSPVAELLPAWVVSQGLQRTLESRLTSSIGPEYMRWSIEYF